mmetsp:Transcript_31054/g.81246  ORF Transcript_31054/g.81246 Transcript_31054/m.81246 type:complete len:149 (+) Transcript_31054:360-806(+)
MNAQSSMLHNTLDTGTGHGTRHTARDARARASCVNADRRIIKPRSCKTTDATAMEPTCINQSSCGSARRSGCVEGGLARQWTAAPARSLGSEDVQAVPRADGHEIPLRVMRVVQNLLGKVAAAHTVLARQAELTLEGRAAARRRAAAD